MKPSFVWVPVAGIREAAERTFVLAFEEPESAAVLRPGQFCMISSAPGRSNVFLPRPFSYFRVAGGKTLEILFRTFGRATRWMANLAPGDKIGVFGPLGNSFTLEPHADRAILVGGGIGLPPLVLLAESLAAAKNAPRIDLIYGEAAGSRVIDLAPWVSPEVRCHIATEDGAAGWKGLATELFSQVLADCQTLPAVYTCGPKAMMGALARLLTPAGVKLFEASCEENMACGLGICQGCVIPLKGPAESTRYQCCCTGGPVFNGFEVKWD